MESVTGSFRPRRLGVFDEESCRFFLQETGQKLVPCYPFSFGIEEVYGLLLERYGRAHVADAMSILHELLEDGQNANGAGDDGDIWRSWRFDWRHRNDDPLNPCAPRVGNYVLPPPTPRRVRLIKSANYVSLQIERLSSAEKKPVTIPDGDPTPHSGGGYDSFLSASASLLGRNRHNMQLPIAAIPQVDALGSGNVLETVPAIMEQDLLRGIMTMVDDENGVPHQTSKSPWIFEASSQIVSELALAEPPKIGNPESSREEGEDSEQEFDEVDSEMNPKEESDPLTISFIMLRSENNCHNMRGGLRGGDLEVRTLRQIRTISQENVGLHFRSRVKAIQKLQTAGAGPFASTRSTRHPFEQTRKSVQVSTVNGPKPSYSKYQTKTTENFGRTNFLLSPDQLQPVRGSRSHQPSEDVEEHSRLRLRASGSIELPHQHSNVLSSCQRRRSSATEAPEMSDNANIGLPQHQPIHPGNCDTDQSVPDPCYDSKPRTRRATNRQARIVDGALISPQIEGGFDYFKPVAEDEAISSSNCRRSSVRLSWLGTPQYQNLRHSWLMRVRSMFHTSQNKQPATTEGSAANTSRVVSDDGQTPTVGGLNHWSTEESHDVPKFYTKPMYTLSLDGACDENPVCHAEPAVYLDKELPEKLSQLRDKVDVSIRTNTRSLTFSEATTERPSTASTSSSRLSQGSSSRRDFRVVAGRLVNPDMAARSLDLSPLREAAESLDPTKYDPLRSPGPLQSPVSFSSIVNLTSYSDEQYGCLPSIPPLFSAHKALESTKSGSCKVIPQSQSEPNLQPFSGRDKAKAAEYYIPPHLCELPLKSARGNNGEQCINFSRGRSVRRPGSPAKDLQNVTKDEKLEVHNTVSKRSASPVKRLLGFGKSSSLKNIAGQPGSQVRVEEDENDKKSTLQTFGDKLRHGLLTSDATSFMDHFPGNLKNSAQHQISTFPVSLPPPYQARIYSDMELLICVSSNTFLMHQFKAGRMSADSVAKVKTYWVNKNRPQVIEFQYDQATQRDLILANLNTFVFHGESAEDPMALNATLYAWKTMSKEMAVRTFCTPDSVIRKHMHDTAKLLELLGCTKGALMSFQETQINTLTRINEEQRKRAERYAGQEEGPNTVHPKRTDSVLKSRKNRKSESEEKDLTGNSVRARAGHKDSTRAR